MNDKHTLCCVCLKEIHHTIACNMCSADCSDCIFDYNYEFKDENQNILICICKQFMKLYKIPKKWLFLFGYFIMVMNANLTPEQMELLQQLQKQKIQRRESQSKSNCKEIQKFILKLENAR